MDTIELLKADLEQQTKRLDLLRAAGSLPELVKFQEEHVTALEKEIVRLSEMQAALQEAE